MEVDKQRIAELVNEVQKGNGSAFDELYKLTSERAYFVALEFTKNNQDAEDILQESYVKALSKINELDKPESFSSWLNQIVANKSKDFLKKRKPMLFEAEENEVFEVIPDENTEFSPEENLDQNELQKTVMEVLDELSEEKRACVLMMYFEELSVGEIAETLEIPEGTVKTRLFSARKDLKEKFSKRGITSAFSIAPVGVVIWALRRIYQETSKKFIGSGGYAKVLSGISVAGTGAAATAAVAGTAATSAGTGIAAKIAAMTAAQKVIAGVSVAAVVTGSTAGVVTVAKSNEEKENVTVTAYTEEYTTAPSFETTLVLEAIGTVEFSETESDTQSATQTESKAATSAPSTSKTSTTKEASSAKATTTKKQTTTKKTTTTKKQTTTKKATTTKKETTTKKATTTKKQTTTTKKATTTQKQTTTTKKETTTTQAATKGKADIEIKILDLDNSVIDTLRFTVDEGTVMTESYLWNLVSGKYSVSGVFGSDIGTKAEADETYRFEAEL